MLRAHPIPAGAARSRALVSGALSWRSWSAMALSTEYVSASAPVPGEEAKFDPAAYGKENYASKVKPAIEKNPVDLATLVPLLNDGPGGGGEAVRRARGHLALHLLGHS